MELFPKRIIQKVWSETVPPNSAPGLRPWMTHQYATHAQQFNMDQRPLFLRSVCAVSYRVDQSKVTAFTQTNRAELGSFVTILNPDKVLIYSTRMSEPTLGLVLTCSDTQNVQWCKAN